MSSDRRIHALRRALAQALSTFVAESDADAVIDEALAAAKLEHVPGEAPAMRSFVMGAVRRALIEGRGVDRFAMEAIRVAHEMAELAKVQTPPSIPPTAAPPLAVMLTLEESAYAKLRETTANKMQVRRAHRLLDLAPLSALRAQAPSTLVVHVDRSPISLTQLARVAAVLRSDCRVLLAGISDRALAQLRQRFPAVERWEGKPSVDDALSSI